MEQMIRQQEMNNHRILNEQGLMESSTRKYYKISPPGGGIPRKILLPSALWITLQWDSSHVYMNMIRVVNN